MKSLKTGHSLFSGFKNWYLLFRVWLPFIDFRCWCQKMSHVSIERLWNRPLLFHLRNFHRWPYQSAVANEMAASPLKLGFVAGAIPRERIPLFERILWRSCRGNVFLRHIEIDTPLKDPSTNQELHKDRKTFRNLKLTPTLSVANEFQNFILVNLWSFALIFISSFDHRYESSL